MSIGSVFGFGVSDTEEGFREEDLLSNAPSNIAKRMLEVAPQYPTEEFIRRVSRDRKEALSLRQKRTYDTTLDVLVEHRKKLKEDNAVAKASDLIDHLQDSPDAIKEKILEFFPDEEFSDADRFFQVMESAVCSVEIKNYTQALHLLLDKHLEKTISLEILNRYGKDASFLSEEQKFSLLQKSINYDLQAVFSLLIGNIHDRDSLQDIMIHLGKSAFHIHPEDVETLLSKFESNSGLDKQYWISHFLSNISSNVNIHLVAQLLLLSDAGYDQLQKIVQDLCDSGHFKLAQDLVDLTSNEIQKQKQKQGALSVACEQMGYVAGYLRYNLFSYSKVEFPGCSEAEMREVITKDSFDAFKGRLNRPSLESVARLRAFVSSKEMSLEKMQQKGAPLEIKENPAFDSFARQSGIIQAVNYYGHGWVRGDSGGELSLLVNGRYMSATEVLKQFELKEIKLGPKMIYGIFDKESGERYFYLDQGLVLYDPTKSFTPIKKVEGDETYSISFITTDHGDTTTDAGIKRLLGAHAWMRMQDHEGNIYSVGKWGDGSIVSPDYSEYESMHTLATKFTVTAEQFAQIKEEIERQQKDATGEFSMLKDNCSEFNASIAKMLFPSVSPEVGLSILDDKVNHLKYYYAAIEITNACFANKKKLKETLEKIETGQAAIKIMEPEFAKASLQAASHAKKPEGRFKLGLPSFVLKPADIASRYFCLPEVQRVKGEAETAIARVPEIAPEAIEAAAGAIGAQVPAHDIMDFVSAGAAQLKTAIEKGSSIRDRISKIEPTRIVMDQLFRLAGIDRGNLEDESAQAVQAIKAEAFQDFKKVLNSLPDSSEKDILVFLVQMLEENTDPKMIPVINDKIKAILRAVSVYLDTGNEASLRDSIFNLLLNLAKIARPFTLNHPYTLFESLSRQKGVKVLKEKPST